MPSWRLPHTLAISLEVRNKANKATTVTKIPRQQTTLALRPHTNHATGHQSSYRRQYSFSEIYTHVPIHDVNDVSAILTPRENLEDSLTFGMLAVLTASCSGELR